MQGWIQDFKLGGALKKINFVGYFVWKITILRQKIIFFSILGGGARPSTVSAPDIVIPFSAGLIGNEIAYDKVLLISILSVFAIS